MGGQSEGGGGSDDVYLIKRIINDETGTEELQGDYASALASYESGKSLKFVDAIVFDGQEFVYCKSFSYAYNRGSSEFSFACYSGKNFTTYTLAESGITTSGDETRIESLHIYSAGGLFLRSSTENSTKMFRVKVSDTGELSTEEAT